MTHEQREVRSDSDEFLDALSDLKAAEERKRREPFSTEPFHELANEVEARASVVWSIAAHENDAGEHAETTGAAIEEVDVLDGRSS